MKGWLILTWLMLPVSAIAADATQNNINEISQHYSALPNLYMLDATHKEIMSDTITRQYVMGSQSMLVKWTFKKGAIVPLHFHPNEQITWITKGSVRVLSQGKEFIVKAGGVIIIPPNVPHEFLALEDTIDMDFFSPARQDWLSNTAAYIQNIQKK